MAEIIEGVHPTRMELLEISDRIELAEKGHRLLKEKRDSLMTEFFNVIKNAKGIRNEVIADMGVGYSDLIKAEALMGSSNVDGIAKSVPSMKSIDVHMRNIMGVQIPQLKLISEETSEEEKSQREYSMAFTSSKLDDATKSFDKILAGVVRLVEVTETITRLGDEIKKTKRRVNALENLMIPRLRDTQKYIKMRLEEMERENFFRLKTVKKKQLKKKKAEINNHTLKGVV